MNIFPKAFSFFSLAILFSQADIDTAHGSPNPNESHPGEHNLSRAVWIEPNSGPLCGIYSAQSALSLLGYKCSPSDFLTSDFIASSQGSDAGQVSKIITQCGARPVLLSGLSLYDLSIIKSPVVANVRSFPSSPGYDHWVTVLYDQNEITLLDGAQKPSTIPAADFLAIWNGIGIAVSEPSRRLEREIWLARLSLILFFVLIVVLFQSVLKRLTVGIKSELIRETLRLAGLTCVSLLVGLLAFGDIRHHAEGIRIARSPYQSHSFPKVSLDEMLSHQGQYDSLLVDARKSRDFSRGSIECAVNIPVYASLGEIRKNIASIDRSTEIFVFCQSEKCEYDESVALKLSLLGFKKVRVCTQGWKEYQLMSVTKPVSHTSGL